MTMQMENLLKSIKQKGIGSMFEHSDLDSLQQKMAITDFSPKNHQLFYTGRHAMKFVIEHIKLAQNIPTIWLPEYYCQHVTSWMKSNYSNIKVYKTSAKENNELIDAAAFTRDGDVVIVNNFWGINACKIEKGTRNIVVVEDHSHGWLSPLCINSTADYCVASLRKSVPAPLGGIAWKPNGEAFNEVKPDNNTALFKQIWNTVKQAQHLKSTYINATHPKEENKQQFLSLVNQAETQMNENFDLFQLEEEHKKVLKKYVSLNYLGPKEKNLKYLNCLIKNSLQANSPFKIISGTSASFGLILFIENKDAMLALRSYFILHAIYPSLLWPDNKETYGYYLNIHIDFRYGKEELDYLAEKIINYTS